MSRENIPWKLSWYTRWRDPSFTWYMWAAGHDLLFEYSLRNICTWLMGPRATSIMPVNSHDNAGVAICHVILYIYYIHIYMCVCVCACVCVCYSKTWNNLDVNTSSSQPILSNSLSGHWYHILCHMYVAQCVTCCVLQCQLVVQRHESIHCFNYIIPIQITMLARQVNG